MASLSRPAPNGHFIKGFSQFIKASSNQKGRPLDLVLGGAIRCCAAQAVYQRPAGHGLQSRPAPMASLARPVLMAPEGPTPRSSPWRVNPLLRRTSSLSTAGRPWSSIEAPDGQFIKASPNGHFIKGFQKGRPRRSGLRSPNPLLRRTSSLATAGRPTARTDAQPFYESLMAALSSYPNGGH